MFCYPHMVLLLLSYVALTLPCVFYCCILSPYVSNFYPAILSSLMFLLSSPVPHALPCSSHPALYSSISPLFYLHSCYSFLCSSVILLHPLCFFLLFPHLPSIPLLFPVSSLIKLLTFFSPYPKHPSFPILSIFLPL